MVKEVNGSVPQSQELETFLPKDGPRKEPSITRFRNEKAPDKDTEAAEFDPFSERKLEHPTSDMDTLTHLLKASLGTGILAMPSAFKSAGLLAGIFFTVLVALICTHCSYILIKCAHVLYKRTRKTTMTFPDVAQVAFESGPQWSRKYGSTFRILILVSLFITYFGTCSVYTVIVGTNIHQVAADLMGMKEADLELRYFIAAMLVPLILLAWVPNLKYLAPVSAVANVFMGVGLGITFYYLVATGDYEFSKRPLVAHPMEWPKFFSITIFAMEAIGVVMPLENAMKTPKNMLGICGVLNLGMSGVTLVYILLGFLGYVRYGDDVRDSITLNLPVEEIPAKIVKVLIALAVYCTFGLQFFVCIEIAWNGIKDRFSKRPVVADYAMRTVLVCLCVALAVAVPKIAPFIGVIGAFCFSILGLLIPAVLEMITLWDVGFGKFKWVLWKNVFIGIFSMFALVFGTKGAIVEILGISNDAST